MVLTNFTKNMKKLDVDLNPEWKKLSIAAWNVRNNSYILGNTMVGVSLLSEEGNIHTGCNIEHKFRSHDIHAEVNAIGNMISFGDSHINKMLIVAERDFFTPCGSCLDWIMQFSHTETLIGFQNRVDSKIIIFSPYELMPYYPK